MEPCDPRIRLLLIIIEQINETEEKRHYLDDLTNHRIGTNTKLSWNCCTQRPDGSLMMLGHSSKMLGVAWPYDNPKELAEKLRYFTEQKQYLNAKKLGILELVHTQRTSVIILKWLKHAYYRPPCDVEPEGGPGYQKAVTI